MIPPGWRPVPGGYDVGPPDAPLCAVLVPGIRGDPAEFSRLLPCLLQRLPGARFHVVRTPDTPDRSLPAIARRVLADLPPEPVRWIGASFGGLLGMAAPPHRLRSLACIGTLPARSRAADRAGWIGRLLPLIPPPLYRRLYARRTAAARRTDGEGVLDLHIPAQAALAARLRAVSAWDLPDQPPAPALCIRGQDDPFLSWTPEEVRQAGITPLIVPGGHFPHICHPERVADVIICGGYPPHRHGACAGASPRAKDGAMAGPCQG